MSHSAHTHQIGPEKQSTCRSTVRARNIPGVCRAIGNVPRAFRLPLSRWWPFSYRIGLPETDNPTPCLSFCGPLLLLETFASKLLLRSEEHTSELQSLRH